MQTSNSQYSEISTYPGEYTPVNFKFEKLQEELSRPHEGASDPDYNICETAEYYKIELAAPGLRREDFFVNITKDGYLSISSLHMEPQRIEDEKYRKHNFNYECFNRRFLLPENLDTDFIKAEYRSGILSFWFFKTSGPYPKSASTIIVY